LLQPKNLAMSYTYSSFKWLVTLQKRLRECINIEREAKQKAEQRLSANEQRLRREQVLNSIR
jgi:hypothetical protein